MWGNEYQENLKSYKIVLLACNTLVCICVCMFDFLVPCSKKQVLVLVLNKIVSLGDPFIYFGIY